MKSTRVYKMSMPQYSDPIDVDVLSENFETIDYALEATQVKKTRVSNTISEKCILPYYRIRNNNDFDVTVTDRNFNIDYVIEAGKGKRFDVQNVNTDMNFYVQGLHEVEFEWFIPLQEYLEEGGGGGGGTTNYNDLTNKPKINGVELNGNVALDTLGIKGAAGKDVDAAVTETGEGLPTSSAVFAYVTSKIGELPKPMQIKGTLGTESGAKASLDPAAEANTGWVYLVVTDGTYDSQKAKIGDMFVSNGSKWLYVPSANEGANEILMTNYSADKGTSTDPIADTDTVNKAVGKLDNRLKEAESKISTKTKAVPVSATANVVTVPEDVAGDYAAVKMVGGKTQKVVQLVNSRTASGWDSARESFSYANEEYKYTINEINTSDGNYMRRDVPLVVSHKYLITASYKPPVVMDVAISFNGNSTHRKIFNNLPALIYTRCATIVTLSSSDLSKVFIGLYNPSATVGSAVYIKDIQCFDLTAMFGTGKEPTTVEEFDAMFIDAYYENGNYLMNAPVAEIALKGKNIFTGDYSQFTNIGGTGSVYDYFKLPFAGSYTMTLVAKKDINIDANRYIGFTRNGGTASSGDYYWLAKASDTFKKGQVVTATSDFKFISMYSKGESTLKYFIENFEIQLEYGSTATEYVPFNKTTLSLERIIDKLPDYGASTGDVFNYIDFENMVYVRNVKTIELIDRAWNRDGDGTGRFYTNPIADIQSTQHEAYTTDICSKYSTSTYTKIQSKTDDKVFAGADALKRIWIRDTAYNTETGIRDALKGVYYVYKLETPELIPLTDLLLPFKVEAGGTIEFVNEHNLDVPNTVIYKKEVK